MGAVRTEFPILNDLNTEFLGAFQTAFLVLGAVQTNVLVLDAL